MMTTLAWIDQHADELLAVYKHLHSIPEVALKEFKTSAYLAEELKKAGYAVQDGIGGTGIVGTLKGEEPGPCFALRADMDALPIEEQTGLPYASTHQGVMHACGHDAHSAMLLYAAKAITANGGIKRGTLKIVFQPAEETLQGARVLLESGVLAEVEEMVGIHVRRTTESPVGEAIAAINHAACHRMQAIIRGRAAHAAWLHKGINVIDAVAAIVNAINAIHADPAVSHSVKPVRCLAGDSEAVNTIPDYAELLFDLRSATNDVMDDLRERTKNAIVTGAASVGATAEIIDIAGVPAAKHDEKLVAETAASIEAVLGAGRCRPPISTPGSEDFHCYSVEAGMRTAFIGLGADMTTGGHTPTMCLDLASLPLGTKILAHLVRTKLC